MSEPTAHRTAPEWNGTATPAAPPSNPGRLLEEMQRGRQPLRDRQMSLGRGSRHARSSDEDYIRQSSSERV